VKGKQNIAKNTRSVLLGYERGKIFTLEDHVTKTGLMYDVAAATGSWPSKYAVKKAMARMIASGSINIVCTNTIKSIYLKK